MVSLLRVTYICVFEHLLGFGYALEHDITLLIKPINILHLLHLFLVDLVPIGYVVKLDQVLGQHQ